ncbi:MAG: hypothetical protein AAGK74_00655 [Chloroflexota bacterium]
MNRTLLIIIFVSALTLALPVSAQDQPPLDAIGCDTELWLDAEGNLPLGSFFDLAEDFFVAENVEDILAVTTALTQYRTAFAAVELPECLSYPQEATLAGMDHMITAVGLTDGFFSFNNEQIIELMLFQQQFGLAAGYITAIEETQGIYRD